MATKEEKDEKGAKEGSARLDSLMAKLRESIQDYLDNIDMDEADAKKAKEKEKK